MQAPTYSPMEEALEILAAYGPDLRNGMTSHAPMVAEALCAMGQSQAVLPWIENYRPGMLPRPSARQPIVREDWRGALGRPERAADWSAFFEAELGSAPWREVLDRWVAFLAPAVCASATHGVIRTGHAVRSLAESSSPRRLRELGDALGYWAANYQELPASATNGVGGMQPSEAILHVAVLPPQQRVFTGTIVSSLEGLSSFAEFAPVIGLIDVGGDATALVHDLAKVFARVYLANARDVLTTIVFVHGVTSVAAVGHLLPHLSDTTGRTALRFAWQAACGLYAAFGSSPAPVGEFEPPAEDAATLADMAVAHGDDHVIKFTEVCLAQHAARPSGLFLAAARHAMKHLPAV